MTLNWAIITFMIGIVGWLIPVSYAVYSSDEPYISRRLTDAHVYVCPILV